jgi:hypothetical protein
MNAKLNLTMILIIMCLSSKANDGWYRSTGGIIYPINETKISIEKEILSFKISDRNAQVNVYFEFFNPDQIDRKALIGFQAPYPSGDSHDLISANLISNFQVIKNGAILPYSIKAAKCENCELIDTSSMVISDSPGVFVYLFEVTFKPGLNIITHSYDFPASKNLRLDQIYRYILRTGSKWAGGLIKDFTLQIDMGKNSYFYVKDIFPKSSEWTIIGTGKITGKYFLYNNSWEVRMVRILSGILEISVKNYKPTDFLDFGVLLGYSFFDLLIDKDRVSRSIIIALSQLTLNINKKYEPEFDLTNDDLLILRNAVYAQNGYKFKNENLLKYFNRFDWYMPDPNLTLDKIVLTEKEKKFIAEIIEKSK